MTEESVGFSEPRRALLQKYLQGDFRRARVGMRSIRPRPQGSIIPLSFAQQQLWHHAHLAPGIPLYNEAITVHRHGRLGASALERALNEFIRRHEAWRTTFTTLDGRPVQVVHPPSALTLPVVDLRGLPEAEREPEALRLATEDARQPYDLARGPLLRPRLVTLADDEHRLFLALHHIIFDGVAISRVFLPELIALYEAFSSGKPAPLAQMTIQYADYAVWQREVQGEALSEHMAYWKTHLAGAPPALELPTDHPRPAVQSFRGAVEPIVLSKSLTDALRALSQREGVTLYMILLAAFKTVLYRYSGQGDILVGSLTSGHTRPELETLIGCFRNAVVLRTSVSGNPTFRDLLRRVRDTTLEALSHAEVPFDHLVEELLPQRDPSRSPLFQVVLSWCPLAPVDSGWGHTQFDVFTGATKYDLDLQLDERQDGASGRLMYNTDLFDASTIIQMRGHLQTLLDAVVADPGRRLAELLVLEALPRTPDGEVNRRALPVPDRGGPEPSLVEPPNELEELIAGIWAHVLGIEHVSTYDNFFDLGGTSLLAMRVIARVESTLGLRINPGELMFQTLGQLAAACQERLHSYAASAG